MSNYKEHIENYKEHIENYINLNDIDIDQYYHPFEIYLNKKYKTHVNMTESYIFTDGIILSRTHLIDNLHINVILIDGPVFDFIMNNFDLDCCKIIYDGNNVFVYNIDDLLSSDDDEEEEE